MQAPTLKQEALESIDRLPDNADMDEIMYQLYVVDKLRKSRKAIAEDQFIHHEELKREIEQW
ncbi:hypothetical protein ACH5Y9_23505 [Methylomonas sp. BW4-1]|uniref:Addiction module component n=1 Tax=Methylomonas defluvii TaxID=3045149 RepID=A0ABU4UJB6_9GAMM|nr:MULTISPECIES: hypothetical protein [unclassified Methylomonas]MDX8128982.1 hypothetical protein [Methylomonas sp. OY6]NOV32314.1 hypothetical protein [Methylomonas sp. ZR1]QSB00899.1 hypothetical protein JWZ98_19955 [Methylomonas sp. EFPC1]